MTDRRALNACVLFVALLTSCPHNGRNGTGGPLLPPTRPPIDPGRLTPVASITRLPTDGPVSDGVVEVPIPGGWAAYRLDADPTMVVRLERATPPAMRIEVHRGSDRVPDGSEQFFDRGRYLGNGRADEVVGIWADRDDERRDVWRFGVLLQSSGRSVVIEGWIPEEDFEAAKRAFDAVVEGTRFIDVEAEP
ncbi:MAG: hypothetical protein QGH45_23315 [Myxococcota bacterium]|jgi:hypothetical protein|nr:hypothetical protein [Myxococcota bacterium]